MEQTIEQQQQQQTASENSDSKEKVSITQNSSFRCLAGTIFAPTSDFRVVNQHLGEL